MLACFVAGFFDGGKMLARPVWGYLDDRNIARVQDRGIFPSMRCHSGVRRVTFCGGIRRHFYVRILVP